MTAHEALDPIPPPADLRTGGQARRATVKTRFESDRALPGFRTGDRVEVAALPEHARLRAGAALPRMSAPDLAEERE